MRCKSPGVNWGLYGLNTTVAGAFCDFVRGRAIVWEGSEVAEEQAWGWEGTTLPMTLAPRLPHQAQLVPSPSLPSSHQLSP